MTLRGRHICPTLTKILQQMLGDDLWDDKWPDIFVETGTWRGDLAYRAAEIFAHVYTVELSEHYWYHASMRFLKTNVTPVFGDSAKIVPMLCKIISEPIMWYLDAHWVGGKYKRQAKTNPLPLWDELRAIASRPQAEVVVVDDYKDFGIEAIGWKDVGPDSIVAALNAFCATRIGDQLCLLTRGTNHVGVNGYLRPEPGQLGSQDDPKDEGIAERM